MAARKLDCSDFVCPRYYINILHSNRKVKLVFLVKVKSRVCLILCFVIVFVIFLPRIQFSREKAI